MAAHQAGGVTHASTAAHTLPASSDPSSFGHLVGVGLRVRVRVQGSNSGSGSGSG